MTRADWRYSCSAGRGARRQTEKVGPTEHEGEWHCQYEYVSNRQAERLGYLPRRDAVPPDTRPAGRPQQKASPGCSK